MVITYTVAAELGQTGAVHTLVDMRGAGGELPSLKLSGYGVGMTRYVTNPQDDPLIQYIGFACVFVCLCDCVFNDAYYYVKVSSLISCRSRTATGLIKLNVREITIK